MFQITKYDLNNKDDIFENIKRLGNLEKIQTYIPIYDTLFESKTEKISLNNFNFFSNINKTDEQNIFYTTDNDVSSFFVKYSPLLDPIKYLCGKYDNMNIFELPTCKKEQINNQLDKLNEANNFSYVDSFFVYLSSQLLKNNNIVHGVDFYGSFLAIKNKYSINIFDDFDLISKSDYFNTNLNELFTIENFDNQIYNNYSHKYKKRLNIETIKNTEDILGFENIDSKYDNIFVSTETNNDNIDIDNIDIDNVDIDNVDIDNVDIDNVDIDNVDIDNVDDENNSGELKNIYEHDIEHKDGNDSDSDGELSSCSSNTECSDDDSDVDSVSSSINEDDTIQNNEELEDDSCNSDEESFDSDDENESLIAHINKYPVQVICMEKCTETMEYYINNEDINEKQWASMLMQVIMTLIIYQEVFKFTHNDLHSNNVMFVETDQKYLFYHYNKKYYKVPTYGKIFKIIDFGRAIYKVNGNTFCSNAFSKGEDADTQYNIEPYFNKKKPRLEPNNSFDLCRLGCSLFDFFVPEMSMIKEARENNIANLIIEWCQDDKGRNVLYKSNDEERYPDFKLYKMIARTVHNHTPKEQLNREMFKKYESFKQCVPSPSILMDFDNIIEDYSNKKSI
jgi:hypothetical protein